MAIRFSNFNLQIRHILSQIWSFLFCTKRCILTNSRLLISNYGNNSSFKFLAKKTQTRLFWFQIWSFLFCTKLLKYLKNSRALASNATKDFSNSSLKIPNKGIFGFNFTVFLFWIKIFILKNLRLLISNMTISFSPKISK